MNYKTDAMKMDQFIEYVNKDKINLVPSFQRGRVWSPSLRRKLIANIVKGRPIPAIFLYKEVAGEQYSYNILDGKQRLESIILFVGNQRESLKISSPHRYFYGESRDDLNFWIPLDGKRKALKDLDDKLFRDLKEYAIPTIEITLNEDDPNPLDEIIELFVDINSYGARVRRFDIVKAMSKDALLKTTFNLLAQREKRGKDLIYKIRNTEFTKILKNLKTVEGVRGRNQKVDRMWGLLVEIILFYRTKKHRKPIEILGSFMRTKKEDEGELKINRTEKDRLRALFKFLADAYKTTDLGKSRLATDQTHFYAMITGLIASNLLTLYSAEELRRKLVAFGQILEKKKDVPANLSEIMKDYQEYSEKRTTDASRRKQRQEKFVEALKAL